MRYLRANDLTTHKTVDDAFRALVTVWDAFTLEDGSGTKDGPNKRLVATKEAIPDALWECYRAEIGETATTETTVAESSDDANEVRCDARFSDSRSTASGLVASQRAVQFVEDGVG